MKFYRINPILLGIRLLYRHRRQFARFTGRHETDSKFIRKDASTDESTRFYTDNLSDALITIESGKAPYS